MGDILDHPLVIGSEGQLGAELMRVLEDRNLVGLGHSQLEIADFAAVDAAIAKIQPTIVINTAAFHNVEECEKDPLRALTVNTAAVDNLARCAARIGAAFATISTDYVFDGEQSEPYAEDDVPNPINAYGVSKYAGEICTRNRDSRHFVFRSSGLFGTQRLKQKEKFVERILRQGERGESPRVVADVIFSPSYAPDVARLMRALIEREAFGIVHITNAGACSWFEFASEALSLAGLDVKVEPTRYRDVQTQTNRPAYSALGHKVLGELGLSVPPWRDGLRRYLESVTTAARSLK
ncbi:MAG: dTDP-4-dehydrorhamnose reductase [Vulcanimicrobiaceae bacterium]